MHFFFFFETKAVGAKNLFSLIVGSVGDSLGGTIFVVIEDSLEAPLLEVHLTIMKDLIMSLIISFLR